MTASDQQPPPIVVDRDAQEADLRKLRPANIDFPEHARHHEHLLENYGRVAESFPKLILLLSGGALALSITFLEKLIPGARVHAMAVLIAAWFALLLSLAAISAAILLSMHVSRLAIESFYESLRGEFKAVEKWGRWVQRANMAAAVFLILGLALLAVFAAINVESSMTEQKAKPRVVTTDSPHEADHKASFVPPRPPGTTQTQPQSPPPEPQTPTTEQKPSETPAPDKK